MHKGSPIQKIQNKNKIRKVKKGGKRIKGDGHKLVHYDVQKRFVGSKSIEDMFELDSCEDELEYPTDYFLSIPANCCNI